MSNTCCLDFQSVKECLEGNGVAQPLSYDSLVELTEHLKACVEVGTARTANWRQFCLRDTTILHFLMKTSCIVEEAVAQTTLQLLQCAVCPTKQQVSGPGGGSTTAPPPPPPPPPGLAQQVRHWLLACYCSFAYFNILLQFWDEF